MRKRLLVSALPVAPAIVLVALGALAATVDACSSDSSEASAPPPLPTGNPVRDAARPDSRPAPLMDASPGEVDADDAGAPARHFTGKLAMSSVTPFGGSPYCKYTMTLKQIAVDVTISGAGNVAAASVTDLAVEAAVQPCPNPAAPQGMQTYSLASSLRLPSGGLHLELAPDPANATVASLVIEGDFSVDHVTASAEWHRTDQQPPLDWRVTTGVLLDRQ
jgi:hypothetical protein